MTVIQSWTHHVVDRAPLTNALRFHEVWRAASVAHAAGIPANELEILTVTNGSANEFLPSSEFELTGEIFRPGIYLLERKWLQDVPVKANNRGLLVSKSFVQDAMIQSRDAGLHIPLSDWFSTYSGDNPPDLYLAQKAEYDMMFSKTQSGIVVAVDPTERK